MNGRVIPAAQWARQKALERIAATFTPEQLAYVTQACREARQAGQSEVAQICCGAAFDLGREGACTPLDD